MFVIKNGGKSDIQDCTVDIEMIPLDIMEWTEADMTVLLGGKCGIVKTFSVFTAVCHSGSLSGTGTLSLCRKRNPSFPVSPLLKLAQVPWGHEGDSFKLIITSIHYHRSWIYSWVHFIITWLCIEKLFINVFHLQQFAEVINYFECLSISNDWFRLQDTPCCWFLVTHRHCCEQSLEVFSIILTR